MGAPEDDVKIRVKLDTDQPQEAVTKLEGRFAGFAKNATKRLAQAGFGAVAGIGAALAAPIAKDLFSTVTGVAGAIGGVASEAIGLGGAAARVGAQLSSIDRVKDAFGLSIGFATQDGQELSNAQKSAIQGLFDPLNRIEQARARGRRLIGVELAREVGGAGDVVVELAKVNNQLQEKANSLLDDIVDGIRGFFGGSR